MAFKKKWKPDSANKVLKEMCDTEKVSMHLDYTQVFPFLQCDHLGPFHFFICFLGQSCQLDSCGLFILIFPF